MATSIPSATMPAGLRSDTSFRTWGRNDNPLIRQASRKSLRKGGGSIVVQMLRIIEIGTVPTDRRITEIPNRNPVTNTNLMKLGKDLSSVSRQRLHLVVFRGINKERTDALPPTYFGHFFQIA